MCLWWTGAHLCTSDKGMFTTVVDLFFCPFEVSVCSAVAARQAAAFRRWNVRRHQELHFLFHFLYSRPENCAHRMYEATSSFKQIFIHKVSLCQNGFHGRRRKKNTNSEATKTRVQMRISVSQCNNNILCRFSVTGSHDMDDLEKYSHLKREEAQILNSNPRACFLCVRWRIISVLLLYHITWRLQRREASSRTEILLNSIFNITVLVMWPSDFQPNDSFVSLPNETKLFYVILLLFFLFLLFIFTNIF